MDRIEIITVKRMNRLLRQIAEADDPGQPLELVGIELGDLTDPWQPDHQTDSGTVWNPYEKLLQRVMVAGYDSPEAAFSGLYAVMAFLSDLLGPKQSLIQLLRPICMRRLLIGLMLTLRLQEPDREAVALERLLLVR